jgi:hypothetical protein
MNIIPLFRAQLAFHAYQFFDRLPSSDIQKKLKKRKWKFTRKVIHPDGKPLYGPGSPGYIVTSFGPTVMQESISLRKRRAADFRRALAQAYDAQPRAVCVFGELERCP